MSCHRFGTWQNEHAYRRVVTSIGSSCRKDGETEIFTFCFSLPDQSWRCCLVGSMRPMLKGAWVHPHVPSVGGTLGGLTGEPRREGKTCGGPSGRASPVEFTFQRPSATGSPAYPRRPRSCRAFQLRRRCPCQPRALRWGRRSCPRTRRTRSRTRRATTLRRPGPRHSAPTPPARGQLRRPPGSPRPSLARARAPDRARGPRTPRAPAQAPGLRADPRSRPLTRPRPSGRPTDPPTRRIPRPREAPTSAHGDVHARPHARSLLSLPSLLPTAAPNRPPTPAPSPSPTTSAHAAAPEDPARRTRASTHAAAQLWPYGRPICGPNAHAPTRAAAVGGTSAGSVHRADAQADGAPDAGGPAPALRHRGARPAHRSWFTAQRRTPCASCAEQPP